MSMLDCSVDCPSLVASARYGARCSTGAPGHRQSGPLLEATLKQIPLTAPFMATSSERGIRSAAAADIAYA
ncbi:hypothetical protein E5D57_012407 [Metarhizium anisopliae]|nr:hypothetical protein E5D57_012407 [Metarhizium anisopliae]